MKRAIPLAVLCAALASCATLEQRAAHVHSDGADQAYHAGRAHQLAGRPDAARAAYLNALQIAPLHLDARNGLAALHVERRELAQAIALWRELTAPLTMASGPSGAYLFSNLGRAHILNNEPQAATAALEKACLLDPLNYRTWQLLGQTLRQQGHEERAQQMLRQAETLRQHDLRADIAATGSSTEVASLGQALQPQPPTPADPGWSQAYMHVGVDGMMELRRTAPSRDAALASGDVLTVAALEGVALLEIRNGNGIAGMARAVSRDINEPGLRVTRLSNQPGFAVDQTRIEYQPGRQAAARRLARRLGSAELREVDKCAPADLRLVLGRDLTGRATPLRPALDPHKSG
jgi:tetratricopeptide (TPR) repeat protein